MSGLPPELERELDEIIASVKTDVVIVSDILRRATELRAERWDPATHTLAAVPANWRGEVALQWGIDVDIAVGDGWRDLLVAGLEKAPDRTVTQVKEKLGELRVYKLGTMTVYLASASLHICETCGRPGRLINDHGWYRVACREHAPR